MKQPYKQLAAILLTLAMVLTVMPAAAFAAGEGNDPAITGNENEDPLPNEGAAEAAGEQTPEEETATPTSSGPATEDPAAPPKIRSPRGGGRDDAAGFIRHSDHRR